MPQALSNLADGQIPGARYVGSAAELSPGEVMVSDAAYDPALVWNAATQTLRPRTTAEIVAKAKIAKRQELLLAFKVEYALIWVIDGIEVEEQKDDILAKPAAQRTAAQTALVNQAGTLITKIKSKFADVNNVTTEAQVQAITW